MLRKRLSLSRIAVLGLSLNDGDQRNPINAQSYDSGKVNCDDCGKVLDVQEGEDIFVDAFVYSVPESRVVCSECYVKYDKLLPRR
ncbi:MULTISPECIES: hypothetical protein [Paenibacillaceae]|uniref:Uncharacterized protein n=2 Tax=Paenibacillus TaxID=44249 RepID=A0ABW5R4N5_9BACL